MAFGKVLEAKLEIFGISLDAIITVALLVGWIILMRFVLPRLGIAT